MDPVDLAQVRLGWAKKHLELLDEESKVFLSQNPYRVEREDDPQFGRQFFRAEILLTPPLPLSLIAADAVNALRSTLDNLVWGLSEVNARRTGMIFDERVPQFPIYDSVDDWERHRWRVRYLPPEAVDYIESIQPYHALDEGMSIEENKLWLLNTLWNSDKHHTLSLLSFTVSNIRWHKHSAGEVACFAVPRVYHDGAIVAFVIPAEPHEQMNIEAEFAFDVAFGPEPIDGWPVFATLRNIHNVVSWELVPRFRAWMSR